jgi:hypothetical protein
VETSGQPDRSRNHPPGDPKIRRTEREHEAMTDPDVARIVAAFLADPAVQAAADQLHAAARDPHPSDQTQQEAINIVLESLTRHAIDILAIPPGMVPLALAFAARRFRAARP